MYINECISCQTKFEVNRNSRRKKFCDSCKSIKLPKTKICKNCEKEFDTSTSVLRAKIFCSHSCSASYNNKSRSLKPFKTNPDGTTKTSNYQCEQCSKQFKSRRKIHAKSVFCSQQCCIENRKDKILSEFYSGNTSSKTAKRILLEIHGNVCLDPLCAWDFSKRNVNVELEHIDGNSHNNNPDNLTLLCPSCHSLTPTYKARNKGNGRAKRLQRYHEGKSW